MGQPERALLFPFETQLYADNQCRGGVGRSGEAPG